MLTFVPKYNLSAKVSIFSMVRGIIYRYLSPSGKSYIGQTTNEKLRRRSWMSDKYHYAGAKIDRARAKYGSSSFLYEVLSEKYYI